MATTFCPDCDEEITLNAKVSLGYKFNCPHCDAELEVISVDPLEVDWVYDWSWDDEEDEEEW